MNASVMTRSCWLVVLLVASVPPVAQADWQDWWRTPEQQAKAAFDAGDAERLRQIAPDTRWQAVAEHESAEYEAAASTFEQNALQLQQQGNERAANKALYNKGVSEVHAGQYEQAVDTFNQVLEREPDFADALHNRDIAQQLIQQQQQQQQQNGSEGDDSSQQNSDQQDEQEQSSESGEQANETPEGEQGQQSEQTPEQQQQSESGDGQQGDERDELAEPDSSEQQSQEEQAAREALEAEASQAENTAENDSQPGTPMQEREQPLSESDQATEQWLRRIPDDPAGLLRRKLEQSHRSEYPQVGNGRETW